ncbi:hypothetical protein Pint_25289 [Pistacia integerrima]|uniref:Uncharacterized protein n=1 Tax=Pistacia integerrima TaxID=434235 RepID=A0ACC0YDT5_9ROSI|nr:hypothetical protein Pint_25289 [Pistacia integerrima]
MLPMSRERYLLNSDDDVMFIFQEYGLKGVVDIKLSVEALLIQIIESLPALLEANIDLETTDAQPQIPKQNSFKDESIGVMCLTKMVVIVGRMCKGHFGGVLLSTVSMDAKSEIYPLAICICEVERYFRCIKEALVERKDEVREVDEDAYKWILENEHGKWSMHAFDPIAKSNHVTNNMSEVFKAWLGDNRELPIMSLLELYKMRVVSCLLHMNVKNIEEHVDEKL